MSEFEPSTEDENVISDDQNDQMVLISGVSGTGKSVSLMNIRDQQDWIYLNCEAGKKLPFRNKFNSYTITDPYQVFEFLDAAADPANGVKGVIIDTISFLMDMFESIHVINSAKLQGAWGAYNQYLKNLMQQKIARLQIPVIILGHTKAEFNEQAGQYDICVPVKGAAKNQGVEAFFSCVVSTKKITIKDIEEAGYDPALLTITDEERKLKYKHVFQLRLTEKTTGERIRSPMFMWNDKHTYMNNDAQLLIDWLKAFYQ